MDINCVEFLDFFLSFGYLFNNLKILCDASERQLLFWNNAEISVAPVGKRETFGADLFSQLPGAMWALGSET